MRALVSLLAVCTLLTACGGNPVGPSGGGGGTTGAILTGTVTTSGVALYGVTVKLASGPEAGHVATTDSRGGYTFSNLSAASAVNVQFSKDGYQDGSKTVDLVANQTIVADMSLKVASQEGAVDSPIPATTLQPNAAGIAIPVKTPTSPNSGTISFIVSVSDPTSRTSVYTYPNQVAADACASTPETTNGSCTGSMAGGVWPGTSFGSIQIPANSVSTFWIVFKNYGAFPYQISGTVRYTPN